MKKNYFMLAAATMMFAACAETDLVNEISVEEAPKAIEFESFANKTTRAEIASLQNLQDAGFQVWGYKYPSDATIVWEDIVEVVKNDDGTPVTGEDGKPVTEVTTPANFYTVFGGVDITYSNGWGYTTTQYWDKTSTYNFYAVAPKDPETNAEYEIVNGMIKIKGVSSGVSSDSKDYLIDRNGNENISGSSTTTHAAVEFVFNHIMSKVSFIFKAGANVEKDIIVTSATMTGWNEDKGNFTQSQTQTPTNTIDISEWKFANTTKVEGTAPIIDETYLSSLKKDDEEAAPIGITVNNSTTTVAGYEYIMVPQSIAANTLAFTINYKIGNEEFIGHTGTITEAQTWGTDTHTTYTITINPDKIDFDVNTVRNWTNSATPEQPIQ